MTQSPPFRLVALESPFHALTTRIAVRLRKALAATSLILTSACLPTLASEVDAIKPLLVDTISAIDTSVESKIDASQTAMAQVKKTLTKPNLADFSLNKLGVPKARKKSKKTTQTNSSPDGNSRVNSAFSESSFSAAFTEALESIARFNASEQPTPASDAVPLLEKTTNKSSTSALAKLKNSVEANVLSASDQEKGRAVKTTPQSKTPKTTPGVDSTAKSTASTPLQAPVSSSVASRKDNNIPPVNTSASPLSRDLQKYFDTLDTEPLPKAAASQTPTSRESKPSSPSSSPSISESQVVESPPKPLPTSPIKTHPSFNTENLALPYPGRWQRFSQESPRHCDSTGTAR